MTTASASCDVVDDVVRPEAVQLCMLAMPMTPAALMNRTAAYASNPSAYLTTVLGRNIFDERKPLLSIPKDIDRDMYGTGTHKVSQVRYPTSALFVVLMRSHRTALI